MKKTRDERQAPKTYPAEKARQAEIELRRPWQRAVFIAGLAGGGVLALILAMFAH